MAWPRLLTFEWDEAKSAENKRKHRVSVEEALLLGLSATLRVLVVCHCYRAADQMIRR